LATAFVTVSVQATEINPKSQEMALQAVQAVMQINNPKLKIKKVLTNSSAKDDGTNVEEVFKIDAFTIDSKGQQSSPTFNYTVDVLDGIVFTINTFCKTCG
jgi:hypothetical protein